MLHLYLILLSALIIFLIFLNRHYIMRKDEFLQKEFEKKKRRKELSKMAKEDISEKKTISSEDKIENKIKKDQINDSQVTSFIKRAETLLAKKDYTEAEKLLIQVLSLEQDNFVANSMLALLYLRTQSELKAESIYRKLLEDKPRDPALYTNLGLAFYNQAKYQEACESYEFAVKLDPNKPDRHINLGQVYFVLQNFEKAITHFKEALKLSPRNVEYLFMLADTYREKGDLPKAKEMYKKVLDREPYNTEAQEEVRRLQAMGY